MKGILLLGASGSVGESTLKILRKFPNDFYLHSFSVHTNIEKAKEIINEFHPKYCLFTGSKHPKNLTKISNTEILVGNDHYEDLLKFAEIDIVVTAIVGSIGIYPTIAAIRNNKKIAIANKETLVTFGPLIRDLLKNSKTILVPVDSEHNALFQLLENRDLNSISEIVLTASGGSFRDRPLEDLANVTIEEALNHPTWKMGPKITIDSAGLINKSLEVIEAHFLFNIPYDKIKVVIHPESIVHGIIEMIDGSTFLYASYPDMMFPIAHSLFYPKQVNELLISKKPSTFGSLQFREVDHKRYPALKLAYEVGKSGGTGPAIFNAANEVAVELFLKSKIKFIDIPILIEKILNKIPISIPKELDEYLEIDSLARKMAYNSID
jgi:1-deoxy-D-xylulose-5-phosphate reductoisomerase